MISASKLAVLMLLVVACVPGCGPSGPATGTVKGKVTIGGAAPKDTIRVNFINSLIGQGGGANAAADGSYTLDQPIRVGEYKVYFEKVIDSSKGPVSAQQEMLNSVPKEFRSESSTTMTQTVNEGSNVINLELPAE